MKGKTRGCKHIVNNAVPCGMLQPIFSKLTLYLFHSSRSPSRTMPPPQGPGDPAHSEFRLPQLGDFQDRNKGVTETKGEWKNRERSRISALIPLRRRPLSNGPDSTGLPRDPGMCSAVSHQEEVGGWEGWELEAGWVVIKSKGVLAVIWRECDRKRRGW